MPTIIGFQEDSSYNIRHRYSVNQGEDVWSQLLYGIRYLDLRVGHYTNTPEKFWIGIMFMDEICEQNSYLK